MSARDVIAGVIGIGEPVAGHDPAQEIIDALVNSGYRVARASDIEQELSAIADWQRSALRVIEAANQFCLDLVTGDANPKALAAALVDGGFDDRFPEGRRP